MDQELTQPKGTYNGTIKKNIMKWREGHKKEYNEYMSKKVKEYYAKDPVKARQKRMCLYYLHKEWKRLCSIDLFPL